MKNSLIGEAILWLKDIRWHQPSPVWLPLQAVSSTAAENTDFRLRIQIE